MHALMRTHMHTHAHKHADKTIAYQHERLPARQLPTSTEPVGCTPSPLLLACLVHATKLACAALPCVLRFLVESIFCRASVAIGIAVLHLGLAIYIYIYIYIYVLYMVFLAGKSPNTRSYMMCIYSYSQPCLYLLPCFSGGLFDSLVLPLAASIGASNEWANAAVVWELSAAVLLAGDN